jgi:hypothetical protein
MAGGSTPAEGPHKDVCKGFADFVADNIKSKGATGGTGEWDQSNWHMSIGSILLAEAFLATGDEKYKTALQETIVRLEEAQEDNGGYAHGPHVVCALNYKELEIVSNWVIMGMGGAQMCGCTVSQEKVKNACNYVAGCTSGGAVSYSHRGGGGHPCRSGGAVMAIEVADMWTDGTMDMKNDMISFVRNNIKGLRTGHASGSMGMLGGALGCLCGGQESWDSFVTEYFQEIIGKQNPDGTFPVMHGESGANTGDELAGANYLTGIYTLVLQLDLGNLRIFNGK